MGGPGFDTQHGNAGRGESEEEGRERGQVHNQAVSVSQAPSVEGHLIV